MDKSFQTMKTAKERITRRYGKVEETRAGMLGIMETRWVIGVRKKKSSW